MIHIPSWPLKLTHPSRSLEDMASDFYLMFKNAQEYNVDGSQIFMDSVALYSVFTQTYEDLQKGDAGPQEKEGGKLGEEGETSAAGGAAGEEGDVKVEPDVVVEDVAMDQPDE
eukprot:sb/3477001/